MKEDNKLDNKVKNPEYFTKRPPFINRAKETKYLLEYFNSVPANILFLYWPINSWKTKIVNNVLKLLQNTDSQYQVNIFDFRSFILDFNYFKEYFLNINKNIDIDPITYTLYKLKESNEN